MWDIVGNTDCSWEPVELRILKQELANMACKCEACVAVRHPLICHHNHVEKYDEEVQVDQNKLLLNEYIYAEPQIPTLDEPQLNIPLSNSFCSNCYIIWDLLRRAKKIFKDEEAETTPDSSDKWTENDIKLVDKTTSVPVINKPIIKTVSSDHSIGDDSDESYKNFKKRTNHERVTFLEDFPHVDTNKIADTLQGNCFCLQKFVDAIRPPAFDYHSYY